MGDVVRLLIVAALLGALLVLFVVPVAYYSGLWFAVLEYRLRRPLRAEFRRIGIPDQNEIRISVYDPDDPPVSITLEDVARPSESGYEWYGKVDDALERLRTVRDGAGREVLWAAFPDRTRPHRVVGAELERIGPAVTYRMQATNGVVLLDPLYRRDERQWEWRGDVSEALRRLRDLPADADRADVWSAFPERTPSVEFRVYTELERIGCEGVVANHKYFEAQRVLLFDTAGEWWEGSVDEALERLRRIPSGAGPEEMWEAFPERASQRRQSGSTGRQEPGRSS